MQLRGELGDVHVLEALVQWVGVVEQHLLAQGLVVVARVAVPVSELGHRSAALVGPLEGWLVASKRLGALPKAKRGVLGRAWGRKGGGALPLPRAAVISTGLRVLVPLVLHAEQVVGHRLVGILG